jgi:hypothetical protein
MRQAADLYTLDLIDKPKRGRPRKPDALTPAQRAKRYRDKERSEKAAREAAFYAEGRLARLAREARADYLAGKKSVKFNGP